MGKFSEKFKLGVRLRQADWDKEETRRHWLAWAREQLAKSSPFAGVDLEDDSDVEVKVVEEDESTTENS